MVNFSASTLEDLQQLSEWIQHDPYHFHLGQPEWWLTGNGLLAFCLMDDKGPLTYVRLDEEGEYIRIHTQFAPESIVPKRRLIVGMLDCMEVLKDLYKDKKGFVFNSVSPKLIAFMQKYQNFESIGNDDYQLTFEGK